MCFSNMIVVVFFFVVVVKDNIAERECCSVPCKCNGQRGDRGGVGVPGPKVKFILRETTYFRLEHRWKLYNLSVFAHVNVWLSIGSAWWSRLQWTSWWWRWSGEHLLIIYYEYVKGFKRHIFHSHLSVTQHLASH